MIHERESNDIRLRILGTAQTADVRAFQQISRVMSWISTMAIPVVAGLAGHHRLVMDPKSLSPRIETIKEEFAARSARLAAKASPFGCRARVSFSLSHFLSPYCEPAERVGTEGRADRHVRGIAPAADQHSADAPHLLRASKVYYSPPR